MSRALTAVLLLWAASADAEGSAASAAHGPLASSHGGPTIISHDPLVEQIRRRQLTQPNGGVTAAVRIASGQTITLRVVDLGPTAALPGAPSGEARGARALDALPVHPALKPAAAKAERGREVRAASEQLKSVENRGPRRGW